MYTGKYAQEQADRPAFIMATSGESLSYGELEARSNRLAHLLRAQGLKRLDHYAVFMENNRHYFESCMAGERSGLYYTCINAYLSAEEMAYVVNNSESAVLITSAEKLDVARQALVDCPKVRLCLVAGGGIGFSGQAGNAHCSTSTKPWQACPAPRSMRNGWALRCSTLQAPPAAPRACCGRCRKTHRASRCRSSSS